MFIFVDGFFFQKPAHSALVIQRKNKEGGRRGGKVIHNKSVVVQETLARSEAFV